MTKVHSVRVDGEDFYAATGDVLLDAALANGIAIPHDCRSGQCGTCVVELKAGEVLTPLACRADSVRACQCRIIADVDVAVPARPTIGVVKGRVAALRPLCEDVVEVAIETRRPFVWLPGQYAEVTFRGWPARAFSPTEPLDAPRDDDLVRFHIRRFPKGRVSSALGTAIAAGHPVRLRGPLGAAYLRPGRGRLVLISGGTGFAPIHAIAETALYRQPDREIVAVVGARTIESLYMTEALCRLAAAPNVTVIPVTMAPQARTPVVRQGHPTDHLPRLRPDDTIHVAGPPPLVAILERLAEAVGLPCHADAFEPAPARRRRFAPWTRALDESPRPVAVSAV